MDALVNIYKTCIQLFSGMNKLQIRSGKLYGLPLTEVGVMENEACIQTNKWKGVVEDGDVLVGSDEREIISFYFIGFADTCNVTVVKETIDWWTGNGPTLFAINGDDTFKIMYGFEAAVQVLFKLQVVVDLVIDIKQVIA